MADNEVRRLRETVIGYLSGIALKFSLSFSFFSLFFPLWLRDRVVCPIRLHLRAFFFFPSKKERRRYERVASALRGIMQSRGA